MRLGGLATSLFKTKVTLVRDAGPRHRTQSLSAQANAQPSTSTRTTPTPEPGAMPRQPQFWAHVYGMEGERMGQAFMTRENMERLQTRGRSPPPPLSKQPPKKARRPKRDKEREKPRGPRVFIGNPPATWKVCAVRDLEPSANVEAWIKGKGKQKETMGDRRRRCYIGDPAPLHEPYGRMPGTASPTPPSSRCSTPVLDPEGSSTPLSDPEADNCNWPQPEVGECCSWAPPPPPGTIAPSISTGLSGPLTSDLPDVGQPGPSGVDMDVDVEDERASTSTALSEEELARAINAALAALSVGPSC